MSRSAIFGEKERRLVGFQTRAREKRREAKEIDNGGAVSSCVDSSSKKVNNGLIRAGRGGKVFSSSTDQVDRLADPPFFQLKRQPKVGSTTLPPLSSTRRRPSFPHLQTHTNLVSSRYEATKHESNQPDPNPHPRPAEGGRELLPKRLVERSSSFVRGQRGEDWEGRIRFRWEGVEEGEGELVRVESGRVRIYSNEGREKKGTRSARRDDRNRMQMQIRNSHNLTDTHPIPILFNTTTPPNLIHHHPDPPSPTLPSASLHRRPLRSSSVVSRQTFHLPPSSSLLPNLSDVLPTHHLHQLSRCDVPDFDEVGRDEDEVVAGEGGGRRVRGEGDGEEGRGWMTAFGGEVDGKG